MEGGLIGSLINVGRTAATIGSRAAAATSRAVRTGTTMAANVSAAQGAAARAAAVADDIAAAARPTTFVGRTAANAANAIRAVVKNPAVQLAGVGLTIGAPIYDVLSTKNREAQNAAADALVNAAVAKAQAEAAADKAQMDLDNAKTKKDNDAAIKAANDATAEQLAAAAKMNKAIEDMQKDYEKWKNGSMGSSTADILNVLNGTATSVPPTPPSIPVGTYGNNPNNRRDIMPSLPTRPIIDYAAPAPTAPAPTAPAPTAPTRRGRQGGRTLETEFLFTPEEIAYLRQVAETQGPYVAKMQYNALIEQKRSTPKPPPVPSIPVGTYGDNPFGRKDIKPSFIPLPAPAKPPSPPEFLRPISNKPPASYKPPPLGSVGYRTLFGRGGSKRLPFTPLPAPYKPPPPTMKEKAEAMLRRRKGGLVLPKVLTRLDDRRGGAKKAEKEILKLLTGM